MLLAVLSVKECMDSREVKLVILHYLLNGKWKEV
jgi:hypothetical protein